MQKFAEIPFSFLPCFDCVWTEFKRVEVDKCHYDLPLFTNKVLSKEKKAFLINLFNIVLLKRSNNQLY